MDLFSNKNMYILLRKFNNNEIVIIASALNNINNFIDAEQGALCFQYYKIR